MLLNPRPSAFIRVQKFYILDVLRDCLRVTQIDLLVFTTFIRLAGGDRLDKANQLYDLAVG